MGEKARENGKNIFNSSHFPLAVLKVLLYNEKEINIFEGGAVMFPFKPNRRYTTIALYAGAVIAAAILFGVLLFNLRAVADGISALTRSLSPILYALVFAYLLSPLVLRFEHLF